MADKLEQALYFPETMLTAIQSEAVRLDGSLSWCVQLAWSSARKTIAQFPRFDEAPVEGIVPQGVAARLASYAEADKRKQTLFFPEEMLVDIRDEAQRQDRSLSWIVQCAWVLAEDELAMRQPAVD